MIRNVYLNGKIKTLLVFGDEEGSIPGNPILEALKEQAEKIEKLEQQNSALIKQEELLISLLEVTAQTGNIMAQNLEILKKMEEECPEEVLQDEESIVSEKN